MKTKPIYIALFFVLILSACNGRKDSGGTSAISISDITMSLSASDTAEVKQLVAEFMDYLANKDYENALDMLVTLNPNDPYRSQPMGLSDEQKEDLRKQWHRFPFHQYMIENITFTRAYDNDVRCKILLDNGTEMRLSIRPLRYIGYWYLSLADR